MRKNIFYLFILLSSGSVFGQNWKLVTESEAYPTAKSEYKDKRNQKIFKLDRKTLDDKLVNATSRDKGGVGTVIIMPNTNGNLERFEIWEASNFSTKDQAKYPNLRSYVGKSLADPSSYIRFSTGPSGISSTIFRTNDVSEFLETYSTGGNYFEIHQKSTKNTFNCSTPELHNDINKVDVEGNKMAKLSAQQFKTYRLALSVTGEYSQVFGGTVEKALEAMNNTMTRVNGVFEKEMAVNFVFADNIESLIYLDANTDPYSNYTKGLDDDSQYSDASVWNVELQRNLRDNFGEANYDIGHLFGHAGGGGNAGCIGCICETDFPQGKGSGFTSPGSGAPKGDSFDIDYVAHEIGHQIGANHTFSFGYESTGAQVQVEPGSGSTIMGYAGITNYNVQNHSDDYFAYVSLKQVQDNLSTKTCGISRPILNTAPKIELTKATYTIPTATAFKLDAKVVDNENDEVLINWEQNNSATRATTGVNSRVRSIKTAGPNFRSFQPVKETYRYFPAFESILADKLTREVSVEPQPGRNEPDIVGESLTTVGRTFDFTVTARDHNPEGPQNDFGQVRVVVAANTTPFKVTSPNSEEKIYTSGSTFDVKWDVGTTNVAPIGTTKVKVSVSWDAGKTFEELGIVDNNGIASFPMPSNAKNITDGYVMIEAVDNIFLAVKKFSSEEKLATKELEAEKFNIYPNPSNGNFTIEQKVAGKVSVEIVDLNGRVVYKATDSSTGNYKKQVSTKLSSGVYLVKITSVNGETTSKIIIK